MLPTGKILILLFITVLFIAGSKEARAETVINNCSILGAAGETYSLANDVFNSTNMTCMRFNADNVTLDCNGHVLDGIYVNGALAVYADGRTNVTVKNCNLTRWWYGVYLSVTTRSLVENTNSSYNYWGAYLTASSNNNISRSGFFENFRDGILLTTFSSRNTIENSHSRNNDYNGIYIASSHWNNLTGLSVYSNSLSGINISSSSNNTVLLGELYSNTKNGIFMGSSSEGNVIENTTSKSNSVSGVYLLSGPTRNVFRNTNCSLNAYDGFYLFSSSDNGFYNVSAYNNQRDGFYLESSSEGNLVSGCGMDQNDFYGIMIQLSSYNNFSRCNVGLSEVQGIRVNDADENRFTDCVVSGSKDFDIFAYSASGTYNHFTNTTFSAANVSVGSGAMIWVKWYLDVQVLENGSGAVQGANVTLKDKFGSTVFSGLTNSTGQIARQTLAEYNQTSSGRNYYTGYGTNVTRFGFIDNESAVNLTASQIRAVFLRKIEAPEVETRAYSAGLVEKEMFKPGMALRVRASVTTVFGSANLMNATIMIRDGSGSVVVDNLPMANVSQISDGYIYEYNYTLPGSAEGLWSINVTSYDSHGIMGYGSNVITVSPLLLQIKLVLNDTSDSIYVPGSGETSFSSLATQEYAAPPHYYIASSHERALKGIVFSQIRPLSILTEKGAVTYSVGIKQHYANSVAFVVFSEGRWTDINSRIGLIESGGFLSSPSPSFGFGLGSSYPVKVVLSYSNIGINNTADIGRGYNRLVIENVGVSGGRPDLKIER
jgi:parallel beta-helix repeat protein